MTTTTIDSRLTVDTAVSDVKVRRNVRWTRRRDAE